MTKTIGDSAMNHSGRDDAAAPYAEAELGPEDQRWLLANLGGRKSVSARIRIATDTDTEGHAASLGSRAVRVSIASDDMDLEGHAFTLHFPTLPDADAFKRGVAAGAISATLLLGGVGAIAVSQSHSTGASGQPAAAAPAAHPKAAPAPQQVINVRWGGRSYPQ